MADPTSQTDPRASARSALRAALRVAEGALALGGAACLLAYAVSCAQAQRTQAVQHARFDDALRAQLSREEPNHADWDAARVAKYQASLGRPVEALGRLEIPSAGVSVMVLEGTDDATLDRAVGRIPGTARPGEPGNVGIAGHRDGWFRGLRHVEAGDPLRLTTLDGTAHYEVTDVEIVAPSRVDVLESGDEPLLTLVTCYPFYFLGDAPQRYIVRARQVHYERWSAAGPAPAIRPSAAAMDRTYSR